MVNEQEMIFKFIHQTDFLKNKKKIMIDVGAYDLRYISPYINKDWIISMFEPLPEKFLNIQEKLKNNSTSDNVKVFNNAVDITTGEKKTFYSGPTGGTSSLISFTDQHKELCIVETLRLDDHLDSMKYEDLTYLKVDTEGNDLPILKSLNYNKYKPEIILSEYENKKTKHLNYTWNDQINFLESKGYHNITCEFKPIIEYGGKHDFIRYNFENTSLADENGWGNIISFKDKKTLNEFCNYFNISQ